MKIHFVSINVMCWFLVVNLNAQQLKKESSNADTAVEAAGVFCTCFKTMAEKTEKLEEAISQNNEKLAEKVSAEIQKEAETLTPCLEPLEKVFAQVEQRSSPEQIIWDQTMKDALNKQCPKVAAFLQKMDEQALEEED